MCRADVDGGRRCLDSRRLRRLELEELRPEPEADRPEVDWPPDSPAEVIDAYGDAGVQAVQLLEHVRVEEQQMTSDLLAALPEGARTDGLQWRLKGPASLARKIAARRQERKVTVAEAATGITDLVRYTAVSATAGELAPTARRTVAGLRRQGWEVREVEHSFVPGNPYMGLHVLLQRGDIVTEVQFHTEDSIAIKAIAHHDYELARDVHASFARRRDASRRMVALWSALTPPPGLNRLTLGGVRAQKKTYPTP